MDLSEVKGWVETGKVAIDSLKAILPLLPTGAKRDEVHAKITAAESALKRSDAALAKELHYRLCQCTFPPQIMLWKETEKAHVCPNPQCGRRHKQWRPGPAAPGENWKTV